MARPAKVGLSYYSMDVGFLRDKKVRLLKSEFGANSVLVVLYVLGKIYEGDGYYIRWDKDEALIAAEELGCGITLSYLDELLAGCLSRSLFDEGVFQMFGVLTSPSIQRRYLAGCEKRSEIQIIKEYWLLNEDNSKGVPPSILNKVAFLQIKGVNNPDKIPFNPDNSPFNPESKVNKSKVNKSKTTNKEKPNDFSEMINAYTSDSYLAKALNDFIEHRKFIKKPMSARALELVLMKLDKLSVDDGVKIAILNQSILMGWQDVFELKQPIKRVQTSSNDGYFARVARGEEVD